MIQRIQSLYFLAIVLICVILCNGSLINVSQPGGPLNTDYVMNLMYFRKFQNGVMVVNKIQYLLLLLTALTVGWTLRVIFLFRDRLKQIKQAKLTYLFLFLLFASAFSTASLMIPGFSLGSLSTASVFGLGLMLFMFYLNFRAIMLIRRDEDLVKDADHIR